MLVLAVYI